MTDAPPKRLLDDPHVASELRADLATARTTSAVEYDVRAGLVALQASLETGGATGAAATGGESAPAATGASQGTAAGGMAGGKALGAGGGLWAAKWWGVAAVGLAGATAVWVGAGSPATRPDAPVEQHTAPDSPGPSESDPVSQPGGGSAAASAESSRATPPAGPVGSSTQFTRSESATGPDLDAVDRSQRSASRRPPRAAASPHSRARAAAPAPRPVDRPEPAATSATATSSSTTEESASGIDPAEVAHLAELRQLLPSRPAEVVRRARQGQVRFAEGMFAEERAALIVFALAALGREEETRSEAEHFLQAHPSGPFSARVRALRDGASPGDPR